MTDNEMVTLDEMGDIKEDMLKLEKELMRNERIDPNLYVEYDVKRGLRDSAGKGVLTGLTEISDVNGYKQIHGLFKSKLPSVQAVYQIINVDALIEQLSV